jgi:hypothetical protein
MAASHFFHTRGDILRTAISDASGWTHLLDHEVDEFVYPVSLQESTLILSGIDPDDSVVHRQGILRPNMDQSGGLEGNQLTWTAR